MPATARRTWSATGVLPCVPKTDTSSAAKRGFFTRYDSVFNADNDHYVCPAGQKLTKSRRRPARQDDMDECRHLTACFTCPLKPKCTLDKLKRSRRWKHDAVLDKMQASRKRHLLRLWLTEPNFKDGDEGLRAASPPSTAKAQRGQRTSFNLRRLRLVAGS